MARNLLVLGAVLGAFVVPAPAQDENVAYGAVIVDRSGDYNGDFTAEKAFDGAVRDVHSAQGPAAYWLSPNGQGVGAYFVADLGESKPIAEILLRPSCNSQFDDRGTLDFEIRGSDDLDAITGLAPTADVILSGTLPNVTGLATPLQVHPLERFGPDESLVVGSYRYLRFESLTAVNDNAALGELMARSTTDNVAFGATIADGSSAYNGVGFNEGSFAAAHVNDGVAQDFETQVGGAEGDYWLGPNGTVNEYFTLDLGVPTPIERIDLVNTHNRQFNDRGTADFNVQVSTDGVTFEPLVDGVLTDASGSGNALPVDTFSVAGGDFDTVVARFVRFEAVAAIPGGAGVGLNEIRVFADAAGDTDGDGMADQWEIDYFGDLSRDGTEDEDLPAPDGLTNKREHDLGLDPLDADSDDDTLTDGAEVDIHGSNPKLADTDGDTLSDPDEVNIHGTNPALADTDGDLLTDPEEIETLGTNPTLRDTDGDGLIDSDELALGLSDPLVADTDMDGAGDLAEVVAQSNAMDDTVVPRGTVASVFTGGDPGEGLDLEGSFLYAFNVGSNGAPGLIGDADFTDDFAFGVSVVAQNDAPAWNNGAEYGDTVNDDNLEIAMRSIRWSGAPNPVDVELTELTVGQRYKLQLLFDEACCPGRAFDVLVDGAIVQNDFNPTRVTGGNGIPNLGAVLTHEFTANDTTLAIQLAGGGLVIGNTIAGAPYNDRNPILQAVTLETLDTGPDTDGDGLPDAWEMENFGNLDQDGTGDPDADSLPNSGEYELSADPNDADTDSDGLQDGAEIDTHGTLVTRADSDGDYLSDGDEVNDHGSDPLDIDSDGDTLTDGTEVAVYGTDPTKADSDGDTFDDPTEIAAGTDPNDPASFPSTYPIVFMGGDPGEGADFEGDFLYAVNVGPDFPLGPVGDADFTEDNVPGVVVTAVNNIGAGGWGTPDYGDTINDDNLEFVMQSIRWSPAPQAVDVQLDGLTVGQRYKLQLLFGENCCWRAWDIIIDGEPALAGFSAAALQGSPGPQGAIGVAVVHEFTAESETFGFVLDGTNVTNPMFPDHNAILNGFTLEAVIADEPFQVVSIVRDEAAGEVRIEFTSVPGASYAADYTDDLDAPFWEELSDGIGATGNRTMFTDSDPDRLARPTGFYRFRKL